MRDCCSSRSPIVVLAVYGHLCTYNQHSYLATPPISSPPFRSSACAARIHGCGIGVPRQEGHLRQGGCRSRNGQASPGEGVRHLSSKYCAVDNFTTRGMLISFFIVTLYPKDDCLREESRFHLLTSQSSITRIKLERAEQEKKWLAGNGRLLRDFASFKDLYAVRESSSQWY